MCMNRIMRLRPELRTEPLYPLLRDEGWGGDGEVQDGKDGEEAGTGAAHEGNEAEGAAQEGKAAQEPQAGSQAQ